VEGSADEVLADLRSLRSHVDGDTILVSTARGVDLKRLRGAAGPGPALFRAVAISASSPGADMMILCSQDEPRLDAFGVVLESLSGVGLCVQVPEDLLESGMALARSALALLTVAMEGIEEGAISDGLPPETARAFATQTLLTTALLLQHRGGSPADLKDQVASPAGTTIAGLAVLEEQGVRGAFIRAMERAARSDSALRDTGRPPVVE
jgi:pyrroline-5-carboxylate reductase